MSYLVLARKWRPKVFDDVIGQEYIIQTLKNAISSGKTAHAFIFSGPRGVGKTSTARIVAKAINCKDGPTHLPCSECTNCQEISEGNSLDVIEIDAASHTGVKDIREIIENVKYLPSSGKTKIYIIDEAHMLSQSAFNALLKTLEEPPPHVLFILATTEVQKIPVTILSRCQRYDFKKVSTDKIKDRIMLVTSTENINITEETIYLIAQESDGSLRDALSLLDQLVATFGTDINHEEATRILGLLDRQLLRRAVSSIFNKDTKMCLETLNEASLKGVSPKRFAEDLLKMLRNALIIRTCGGGIISNISTEEIREIELLSNDHSIENLELLFNLMLKGAEEVQQSFYPQMALEVTLVKLTIMDTSIAIEDILKTIEKLSDKLGNANPSSYDKEVSHTRAVKQMAKTQRDKSPDVESKNDTKRSEDIKDDNTVNVEGLDFLGFLKEKKPVIAMQLEHAESMKIGDSIIKIEFPSQSTHYDYIARKETQDTIRKLSKEFFGRDYKIVALASSSNAENTSLSDKNSKIRSQIQNTQAVQDAMEILRGRIVNIKIREKE
ncbi:MAG TPA: DNA polymerase III subunit gamma/tau [Thermodesulfobacteriota bacterium]